jgi:hypothetical protein
LDFSGFVKDVAKTYDGSAGSVDKDLQELCKGSDLTVETAYQDKNSKTLRQHRLMPESTRQLSR